MVKVGGTRGTKGRSSGIVLLGVAGCVGFIGRSWSFCSSSPMGALSLPSRSESKVQVRFMGMDKNNDGKISVEEFRSGMKGVTETGKFHIRDFFGSVGLSEDELSTVFTVVGEQGRLRLWSAMQQDLDLGTVQKGFPHFNSELNTILPGLPRFNSGYSHLDKDKDGKISDDEFQEGVDMVIAKAGCDSAEFFRRIGSSQADLRSLFNKIDDLNRVQLWQALVRDVDMGNTKDFPLFVSELKMKSNGEAKKFADSIARRL